MNRIASLFLLVTACLSKASLADESIRPIEISDFSGQETVIDFTSVESLTAGHFHDSGLTGRWIAEKGTINVGNLGSLFDNVPGASLGNALASSGAATVPGNMEFILDEPVRRFGLLISTGSRSGWQLTAYGALGQPLGTVENSMRGNGLAMFLGAEFAEPAKRLVIFEHIRSGQNDSFDDIRFEAVPEPTQLSWLVVSGIVLLAH